MLFAFAFSIDENVIKVYYHKNIKLCCQNFIVIALKCDRYIGQSKKHNLIFEVAITVFKGYLLFIAFSDPHLMIGVGKIKLSETSSLI